MDTNDKRRVLTELPGQDARTAMALGRFDMQHRYRSVIMDAERSEGVWLHDLDGNVFLDLFGSFALGALGYNHPALLATAGSPAFARAAANPTSTPFLTAPDWLDFIHDMETRWAPAGMGSMYCVDGGGEGVESALKAAFIIHGEARRRAHGHSPDPLQMSAEEQASWMHNAGTDAVVIAFEGAFHGRGLGPLSATHSKLLHKADLPAFPWPTVPFPANRWPLHRYAEENAAEEARCLAELERVLDAYAGRVAAIIVEPIQSEGGDRHASPAFYQAVQRLAGQAGAAFILDEVQTGVATSGRLWATEHLDLPTPPDLLCFGKKMQMGGFFATPAYTVSQFGRMYQTRNGDRCKAQLARTVLRTIEGEDLLRNVRETGAVFLEGLQALSERHPDLISQARGRGFLLAFDLPTAAARDEFNRRALARGVFATYTGSRSVRLRPHLVTRPEHARIALTAFAEVAAEMDR